MANISNGRWDLKFMIGHLGLGSNVQHGLVDFKFYDQPTEIGFNWPTGF